MKTLIELMLSASVPRGKHPKCKGYESFTGGSTDYDCGYNTALTCDECKYGVGRRDPEAKCNQSKGA